MKTQSNDLLVQCHMEESHWGASSEAPTWTKGESISLGWIPFHAPEAQKTNSSLPDRKAYLLDHHATWLLWMLASRLKEVCWAKKIPSCFSDRRGAIRHQALLQDPHLPIPESLKLPISAFILVFFLPFTIRGNQKASSLLWGPAWPDPNPSMNYSLSLLFSSFSSQLNRPQHQT